MDNQKFQELVDGIRQQLEDENLDYVLVIANHQESQAVEGIVGIHADHGIQVPADMLFSAALEGEKAPQHFIDRVIDNVIDAVQNHHRDRIGQRIDKDKIQYS